MWLNKIEKLDPLEAMIFTRHGFFGWELLSVCAFSKSLPTLIFHITVIVVVSCGVLKMSLPYIHLMLLFFPILRGCLQSVCLYTAKAKDEVRVL